MENYQNLELSECPTGIQGLDEITGGGLPKGRPILICGSAGCGKTLFGVEFLVRGATLYDEPGVLMTFEETVLMKLKINYTQKEKVDTLGQLMDDISRKAIARGLTPEILEEILNEDE